MKHDQTKITNKNPPPKKKHIEQENLVNERIGGRMFFCFFFKRPPLFQICTNVLLMELINQNNKTQIPFPLCVHNSISVC